MIVKKETDEMDGYVYDENFLKKLAKEVQAIIKTKNFLKLTSLKDLR